MPALDNLKKKKQEFIINDKEFLHSLNELAKKINKTSDKAKNEAEVVSAFDVNFVPFVKDLLDIDFTPNKEESIDTVKYQSEGRKNKKGRIDSRIGSVIIEFKHKSKFKNKVDIDSATDQTLGYLHALNRDEPGQYVGIVTDGLNRKILMNNQGEVTISSLEKFNGDILQKICSLFFLMEKKALSPENLAYDFCNPEDSISNSLISSLLNTIENSITGKTQMLFNEWKGLFKLAHDDKSKQTAIIERKKSLESVCAHPLKTNDEEYKVLYALQTSYAIIIKIIAFKVISNAYRGENKEFSSLINYDSEASRLHLSDLEDGAIFRDYGIGNLLEGDFFSWYCASEQWNDGVFEQVKKVINVLTEYEDRDLFNEGCQVNDLFKDLYMGIIPDKVRHSLGEFYTPPWLADNLITEASKLSNTLNWTSLDPCCGSGTFITTLINKVLERQHPSKEEKLKDVLSSVQGLDLNPLAVLSARINYFINISHLIEEGDEIEIPIYLGDSSYVPERITIDNIDCLKYEINTLKGSLKILLPLSAVKDPIRFSKTMTTIEQHIKNLDSKEIYDSLCGLCSSDDLSKEIKTSLQELSEQFVDLEKQDWNGIWARIVTNFLTTANLGKFDLIVGNPPWIDWKNLPAGYRDRVKKLCVDRHLFSGDKMVGGINLNICALISNVAADNWLKDDGILSFLMPQNIVFQQTYEGFRNFETTNGRLYLQQLFDWAKSGHPFKPVQMKFSTYFFSKKAINYKKGIPLYHYNKKPKTPSLEHYKTTSYYSVVEPVFNIVKGVAGNVNKNNTAFSYAENTSKLKGFSKISGVSYYDGREGVEFFPQELFLWKFIKNVGKKAEFENYQGNKSKYKVPLQSIISETKFLHPLIKGTNIEPFYINEVEYYSPFPYEFGSRKPLVISELTKESPLLAKYFTKNKSVLEQQTDYNDKIIGKNNLSEFYALARVGVYSYGEYFVCFRDNTKWQAAVVSNIETPWGESKRPVFQNHAVSISQREDGSYITKNEAHFICSIINAPIVKEYMEKSSDSRSFKIRPPINIPVYNEGNPNHKQLSKLSIRCHKLRQKGNSIDNELNDIDALVRAL
ncbi:hypothetical protein BJAS_P4694 [Bathymodiolus japonicus methanotrophic gill symbiont]|uniref:Eco57I restriction-modification methylase domain-containing protein n=1 Tax=Bathymodiolus japonicus methanotrophic gill symbiont TaxID=113269 RepID=UPI001B3ECF75|nr:N-6 DNA methylase [Bathymodiolus japonicus methanotrophic gill symbiont]GFO73710.1 hypothetical protein BJAS_P4694 [Bathymodiolus japonicus methanotrophic gill symbiont]